MILKNFLAVFFSSIVITSFSQEAGQNYTLSYGGIVRGDTTKKEIALVFTGDEFGDGLQDICAILGVQHVKGSFFFTGRFYRNDSFAPFVRRLHETGNYMGPHSDAHLLYCDWTNRDSLLVSRETFTDDIQKNFEAMRALGIDASKVHYFIPPYEWWNDSVAAWAKAEDLQVINFSPGIQTGADYTYPGMGERYRSSESLVESLKTFEAGSINGLNGCLILIHAGTDPRRTDKLYKYLGELINYLRSKGYEFKRVDEMIDL